MLAAAVLLVAGGPSVPALAAEPGPAPDFALKALDGRNHRLSEHRGEVVALLFWGSWCGACRNEIERLERLRSTYAAAGLAAYGIVLDEDPAEARSITDALGAGYPQLHDRGRAVAKVYRPRALPMLLLVDRGGVVRFAYGELDARGERAMLADLRSLLDE
ncbi:MAG: TlpA family protein disulfide reductase [Steroidobacteraceae bacterium]|nr:TlpA family protein disulfide reductase [Steroidobacteraceae bacterium]